MRLLVSPTSESADHEFTAEIDAAATVGTQRTGNTGATTSGRWIFTNMVESVDGAASVNGKSGALGGPDDLEMFRAFRAAADVIVVGAGTVRAERYRLPRPPEPRFAHLRERPGGRPPRLCVVSRSMDLSDDLPFLVEAAAGADHQPTIIATCDRSKVSASETIREACEVLSFGQDSVDLIALMSHLEASGLHRILCEGGPTLLGELGALDLVDEWNFTISPSVVGGSAGRPVSTPGEHPNTLRLQQLVMSNDSTLFARYVRAAQS